MRRSLHGRGVRLPRILGRLRRTEVLQVGQEYTGNVSKDLMETRLRPEATYCYLLRLILSFSKVQKFEPTHDHSSAATSSKSRQKI